MPFSIIPFLLLAIPLAEIAAFIVIGGQIGVMATLALVLVTAVIGSFLLRSQGLSILSRIRSDMDAGRMPARELFNGLMIAIAGVLLLTPGFVTDTMGFLLFVPPVRDAIWNGLKSRVTIITPDDLNGGRRGPDSRGDGSVIDLDEDDFTADPDPDSPWASDKDGQDRS